MDNARAYSTKKKAPVVSPDTPTPPPHESKRDTLICVYKPKETMYSNQMGLFSQVSSLGNKYIVVIHNVNSISLKAGGPQEQHWWQTYPWLRTGPGAHAEGRHCP
jgi:hypothetical protein